MTTLPRIPIARPDITDLERDNVRRVMESGWITQGEFVAIAEKKLCELTGRKFAIACSSGTTALIAALIAAGGDGKRIAVPTLTFAAVWNAVELLGYIPCYRGVDKETWQVPLSSWKQVVGSCHAFIAAPCYGLMGDMEGLETFCRETRTVLIEDACESFGAFKGDRNAGSFGNVSVISTYANKLATSAEGGACLTDDEDLANKIRTIVNHGIEGKQYQRSMVGLNGRMTDIHAAILTAQIERLPEMMAKRRETWSKYESAATENGWTMPRPTGENIAPWLWAAIPPPRKITNDSLRIVSERLNIETRPIFPVGHQSWNGDQSLADAFDISSKGVVLPLSSAMSDEEVGRVVELIRSV